MVGSVQLAVPKRTTPLPTLIGACAASPACSDRRRAASTPGSCGSDFGIADPLCQPLGDEPRAQVNVDLAQPSLAGVDEAVRLVGVDDRHLALVKLAFRLLVVDPGRAYDDVSPPAIAKVV